MGHDNCDFSGYVTKNDLKCADGRVIRRGAFRGQNGKKVPLVWNHQHNSSHDVLGHVYLEDRDDGVYGYGYFNGTAAGKDAKEVVSHKDVEAMSIYANNLQQVGPEVLNGAIREVSLVLAGANPGAFIESVLAHGEPMEDGDDEGIFYTGEGIFISHAIEQPDEEKKEEPEKKKEEEKPVAKTVADVYNTLNDDQKKAVAVIVGAAVEEAQQGTKKKEEEPEVRHTIFNKENGENAKVLTHSDYKQIFSDAKRLGSLREAFYENFGDEEENVLMHSIDTTGMTTSTGNQVYGFNDPDMLFPEYKAMSTTPEWISRNMDWVQKVMGSVHHTPFSRIKSLYANITEDEARARGYMKGNLKKEEVFTLLKRTTDPQTIYKKQKLDRDDIIDITDFDVVAWIKAEMRVMLNEEIARAILIGDGRPSDSEDKIKEDHIRPIVTDKPLYNIVVEVPVQASDDLSTVADATIDAAIRGRKGYKGSGNPTLFTTEDVVTEMLLLKDSIGHRLYKTEAELATTLRVKEIVTVEPMEGHTLTVDGAKKDLIGVIVNLADYNVGADKGGAVSMFDDFDIDYNQQKYLIETRISGALIKPFSAITLVKPSAASARSYSSRATE